MLAFPKAEDGLEPGPMIFRGGLSDQKILVTGASGFLGSHLSRRLALHGAEVHGVSRDVRATETSHLHWWQGDMADIVTVRRLLGTVRPDVIVHLSGLSTAAPDLALVLPTFHSLLTSTVNILAVATEIECRRVVLAASLTEPALGDSDATPASPYAAAKWAGSVYARMFRKLYQVPVIMVRPFMTYGPGQEESKLIPHVILSLLRGRAPRLSSGEQQFDWIYVDDVIDGLLVAAEVPSVTDGTIDLGSGVLVPVRTVVRQLATLVGAGIELVFGSLADRPFERARVANIADAAARLGWRPTTALETGLERTVAWYRTHVGDRGGRH